MENLNGMCSQIPSALVLGTLCSDGLHYGMWVDLPSFNGHLHIEEFLDWISEVEKFFDYMNIAEGHKVELVALCLKGTVAAWWDLTGQFELDIRKNQFALGTSCTAF